MKWLFPSVNEPPLNTPGIPWQYSDNCIKNAVFAQRKHYVLNNGIMFNEVTDIDKNLETVILVMAFADKLSKKVTPKTSLKQYFNVAERDRAQKIVKKIKSEISNKRKILINSVCLLLKTERGKENSFHKKYTVFYFKANDNTVKYVDTLPRIYNSWNTFLEKNKINPNETHPSLFIYPEIGHYGQQLTGSSNEFDCEAMPVFVISESPEIKGTLKKPPQLRTSSGDRYSSVQDNANLSHLNFQKFFDLKSDLTEEEQIRILENGPNKADSTRSLKDNLSLYFICASKCKPGGISVLSWLITILNKIDAALPTTIEDNVKLAMAMVNSYGVITDMKTLPTKVVCDEIKKEYTENKNFLGSKNSDALSSLISGFETNVRPEDNQLIRKIVEKELITRKQPIDTPTSLGSRPNLLSTWDEFHAFASNNFITLNGIVEKLSVESNQVTLNIDEQNEEDKKEENRDRLTQVIDIKNSKEAEIWIAADILATLLDCDNAHMIAGLIEMIKFITSISYLPDIVKDKIDLDTNSITVNELISELIQLPGADKVNFIDEHTRRVTDVNENLSTDARLCSKRAQNFIERIENRTNYYKEKYKQKDAKFVRFVNWAETYGDRAAAFEAYGHGLKKFYRYFNVKEDKEMMEKDHSLARDLNEWIEEYLSTPRNWSYSVKNKIWKQVVD